MFVYILIECIFYWCISNNLVYMLIDNIDNSYKKLYQYN